MEAMLSSGGPELEPLVGNIAYGLDPQASYVTGRRQSTTFSNVNSASPDGVKTITINMGSASEWLDPSTVLLSFVITNTDAALALWPATPGAESLISRLQVRLGSTLVEDIQDFGKLSHIMHQYSMSPQKRLDQSILGFSSQQATANGSYFLSGQHEAKTIAAGVAGGHVFIEWGAPRILQFCLAFWFVSEAAYTLLGVSYKLPSCRQWWQFRHCDLKELHTFGDAFCDF